MLGRLSPLLKYTSGRLFRRSRLRGDLAQRVLMVVIPVWLLVAALIYVGGYNYYLREREQAHKQYHTLAYTSLESVRSELETLSLQIHEFILSLNAADHSTSLEGSPVSLIEQFIDRHWAVVRQKREELNITHFDQNNNKTKYWGSLYSEQDPRARLTPLELEVFRKIEYSGKSLSYLTCDVICYYNLVALANHGNKAYGKLKFRLPMDYVFRTVHRRHAIQYGLIFEATPKNHGPQKIYLDGKAFNLFPIISESLFAELFPDNWLTTHQTNTFKWGKNRFAATAYQQPEHGVDTPQAYRLVVLENVSERYDFINQTLAMLSLVTVIILTLLVLGIYSVTASLIKRLTDTSYSLKLIGEGQYEQAQKITHAHLNQASNIEMDTIHANLHKLTENLQSLEAHNQQQQQYLLELSEEDPLTGLSNRRALNRFLDEHCEQKQAFSLLLIDVNYFKVINDTYGHHIGDQLLVSLSNLLVELTGESGIAGRSGGDEFYLLFPHRDDDDGGAETLAKRILSATPSLRLEELTQTQVSKGDIHLSLSIGITHYPLHSQQIDELLTFADIAMYECKRDRSGGYHVYNGSEKMLSELAKSKYWQDQLHTALLEQRLLPYFQEIILTKDRTPVGQEALARIEYQGNIHTADFFIDSVASHHSVVMLDMEMLSISIEQFAKQQNDLLLFVNLSSLTINHPRFIEKVETVLSQHPRIQNQVVFEISEKTAISDMPRTMQIIRTLNQSGIRFALDDFGKGYSSLQLLHELPIHYLKLDRSLIASLGHQAVMQQTLTAITSICHSLNVEVIAEGVENEQQYQALRLIEVDYLQGYYFSYPQPLDDEKNSPAPPGFNPIQPNPNLNPLH